MKYYPIRFGLVVTIAVTLVGIVVGGTRVLAQEPESQTETVNVTSPADGDTVSDIITVTGTVDFLDFLKYEIFLKSGKQMIWGATVYAPVINGNLARLDTRVFADGAYQLVVRQVHIDSNYTDFIGPTINIENELGAPLPFPEVETSFLYPPPAGALVRVTNCSGFRMEFDYVSPQSFCSSGTLWIAPKLQNQPLCTSVDILMIPNCEYRGTIFSEDGQSRALNYMFLAEPGKIYAINYPGGELFFIGEVPGDERAGTDTGGFEPGDPARYQPPAATPENAVAEAPASAPARAEVSPAPTGASPQAPVAAAPTAPSSESTEPLLPVSGQAAESKMPFAIAAVGLILFMVVGGAAAIRRGWLQRVGE